MVILLLDHVIVNKDDNEALSESASYERRCEERDDVKR